MELPAYLTTVFLIVEYVAKIVAIGVIPNNRRPSSSSAWLLLILFVPVIGFPLYWLIGSPWVKGRRYEAQRASDVDVVWIMGYGWPVYRGGPMFWAQNEVGLKKIVEGLEKHGFKVAESLKTAAETGAALK